MDFNSQSQSTSDLHCQGAVTYQCDVPPTYATAGGASIDLRHVNNDYRPVIAYEGQSCLPLWSEFPGSWGFMPRMNQQLPRQGLVYGHAPFQECNFPGAGLGCEADLMEKAQHVQGELYKTASKAA